MIDDRVAHSLAKRFQTCLGRGALLCASAGTVKSFFWVVSQGVFGAQLTPACLARLGARAAFRMCATVARPRSMLDPITASQIIIGEREIQEIEIQQNIILGN